MAHALMVGGAEETALNLVRHLPPRFEPMVCCIHEAGPIGEEIRRTGTPVAVLGLTPGLRRPGDVIRLRRYLCDTRPSIVHTFLLTASLYGRLAAILARVPVVIGTEMNVYEHKRRAHALAERLLLAGTDRVIASAGAVRDFYVHQVGADPAKVDVVYNAVDFAQGRPTVSRLETRASLGLPADAPVAGIVARLTRQKGHRDLFEALASSPKLADVQLLVIGGGEEREALEQEAISRGLSKRVHFLGVRRDVGNLLAAMDVFVLPSLWEGLPLAMVEAMGAGIPVVASRVAGIPEVVDDSRTGLLVPPSDPSALGAALTRLIEDPQLRQRIGGDGSLSVLPRFGIDRYVESITSLYDALLERVA
jgi:glycosyltransferase involved in cell wall biosynthesis